MMYSPKRLAQLLAVAAACATAGSAHAITTYSSTVQAGNPSAYWQFEDASVGAGAADSALANGAQNGVYVGNATLTPNGVIGQAMSVTSANPVGGSMQASNVIVGNNLSAEAWIKADTANWTANGWGPNAREANGFLIHPDNGGKSWRGFIVDNAGAFTQIGLFTPAAIDDKYHHYAITFDDATNTGRMYFDGVLVATNTGMTLNRDASDTITVFNGRDSLSTAVDRRGSGSLDEVAIYNAALGSEVIKSHYMIAKGFNSFSNASELDLSGKFVYAIDIGNTGGGVVGNVLGVNFTGEAVAGATVTSDNLIPAWGTKPEYGADASNNSLENIMHSIRFDNVGDASKTSIAVDLAVEVGQKYKLQLLFSEQGFTLANNRSFDIEIEGQTLLDEAEVLAVTGAWSGTQTVGGVFTYEFVATDSLLNIRLLNGTQFANRDPILNALTLEIATPEPASMALVLLAAAAMGGRRRRA